jgi:hypothetical protein
MHLLWYRVSDGGIEAVWSANTTALLEANLPAEDPTHGVLYTEADVSPRVLQTDYLVQDGTLVPKASKESAL